MSAEIHWERVHGVGDTEHSIYRTSVPGGWLVFHRYRTANEYHLSDLVYVPDQSGLWANTASTANASAETNDG